MKRFSALAIGFSVLAGMAANVATAAEPCSICATTIRTNGDLAACFLSEYDALAKREGGAVVVDLSDCEASRGVVEALPTLGGEPAEPDVKFILSRPQLECLKGKLEDPALTLDPSATIELGQCP